MATYYFSTTGDNTRTAVQAQSPSTPWVAPNGMPGSTSTAAAFVFTSGDTLLFKRGDVWEWGPNQYFNMALVKYPDGGGHYTFGAYYDSVTGADDVTQPKPIWWQRGVYTAWTHDGSGIWKTSAQTTTRVYRCFFNMMPQNNDATSSAVTATSPWWWDDSAGADDGKLWVYTGDTGTNPTAQYGEVWTSENDNFYMARSYLTQGEYTVSNIEFRGCRGAGWSHVTPTTDASNINIISCDFNYCDTGVSILPNGIAIISGVRVANCTFDTHFTDKEAGTVEGDDPLADYTFSNSSNFFVITGGLRDVIMESNVVRNIAHCGFNFYYSNASLGESGDITVRNNFFEGAYKWHGRGVAVSHAPSVVSNIKGTTEFYGNIIQNTATRNQLDGHYIKFHHNIIRNTRGDTSDDWNGEGISVNTRLDAAPSDVDIYNNTVYNTRENSIKIASSLGEVLDGPVRIFNNIFYQEAGWQDDDQQPLTNISIAYGTAEANLQNLEVFNNCLYHADLGIGGASVDYGGSTMTLDSAESTLNGSSKANMYNNIEADPLIDTDYTLSKVSICINSGAPSPYSYDIYSRLGHENYIGAARPKILTNNERREL